MAAPINIQTSYAPELPLEPSGPQGYVNIVTLPELVKQNFKNVLLTSPGERAMKRDFGVGLRAFLFEPDSLETRSQIKTRIMQQANKYLPFIKIFKIDLSDPDMSGRMPAEILTLSVSIKYIIKPLEQIDEIDLIVKDAKGTLSSSKIDDTSTRRIIPTRINY